MSYKKYLNIQLRLTKLFDTQKSAISQRIGLPFHYFPPRIKVVQGKIGFKKSHKITNKRTIRVERKRKASSRLSVKIWMKALSFKKKRNKFMNLMSVVWRKISEILLKSTCPKISKAPEILNLSAVDKVACSQKDPIKKIRNL